MKWLDQIAASARIVASGNRFSAYVCMFYQYCCTHGLVSGYLLQSTALGIQFNPGLPGPLGHALHPMLSAIHHSDMRIACLRLHPQRQPPTGYLAGSGPCYEHPRPVLLAPRVAQIFFFANFRWRKKIANFLHEFRGNDFSSLGLHPLPSDRIWLNVHAMLRPLDISRSTDACCDASR